MIDRLGRKSHDADYGMGEHSIDGDRLGLVDEQQLTDRLIRTFSEPSYKPPRLPAVALELLALSQQPDVEFATVEALLERDAMLTGEVLSVARSAIYSRTRPPGSLRQALVRVGLGKLREIVMQAAVNMRVFRSATYAGCMDRLRRHSQATAHLGRIICGYTLVEPEQAFLCGLVHDVGIAGILLVLGDVRRGQKAPDLAVLWPAIDAAHSPAGARMVELWGLSPEIVTVVGAHHAVRVDGKDDRLAACICLADALSAEFDLGFVPTEDDAAEDGLDASGLRVHGRVDRSDEAVLARAIQALNLCESKLEEIRAEARSWCESAALAPTAG